MQNIVYSSVLALLAAITGCTVDVDDPTMSSQDHASSEPNDESTEKVAVSQEALSEVTGCHFYVGSNYGGSTLWRPRGSTIGNLHNYGFGDKISSVRLRGGATTRMWIDTNYGGTSWYITKDVMTFHDGSWGNLGDNSSSMDCY